MTNVREQVKELFRRDDPETSAEAIEQHHASGKRQSHKDMLLGAVRARPGWTSAELAQIVGLERHEGARRLADLRNDGLVRQGEPKKCAVVNKSCKTWWPE